MTDDPFADVRSADMETRRKGEVKLTELLKQNPELIPKVLDEIRTGDVNSRWYLGRALLKLGPDSIPELVRLARQETDITVLKYIGSVLAGMGKSAVRPLIDLLSSDNAQLRGIAAAALERIGEAAYDDLITAAKSSSPLVSQCAVYILQKKGVYPYES